MNKWNIKFDDPKDSDYEEGRFSVDITFSLDYPNPFLLTNFIMMYFIQIQMKMEKFVLEDLIGKVIILYLIY